MSQNQNQNRKVLWVNADQAPAYLAAKAAVMREKGPDVTEGQVVEELANAYTGTHGDCTPTYCRLVDETAAQNGDPVYSRDELAAKDHQELRRMAADANTDEINGKSTRLEITAYFSCPYPVEDSNGIPESE